MMRILIPVPGPGSALSMNKVIRDRFYEDDLPVPHRVVAAGE